MLTIPINNTQNEGGKHERKSSDKANSKDRGQTRKPIHNASAKIAREIAVNT